MNPLLDQHYRELHALEARAVLWSRQRADIAAIVLVGSFARDEPRIDSDIDLILLVEDPERLTTDPGWLSALAPDSTPVRTGQWGPVTEHRVTTQTGLDIEFGVAAPSWADLPLDPGTARVLRDGARPIYDPDLLAAAAIHSARQTP